MLVGPSEFSGVPIDSPGSQILFGPGAVAHSGDRQACNDNEAGAFSSRGAKEVESLGSTADAIFTQTCSPRRSLPPCILGRRYAARRPQTFFKRGPEQFPPLVEGDLCAAGCPIIDKICPTNEPPMCSNEGQEQAARRNLAQRKKV